MFKPISSAPKDGTEVLLWWGGDCAPVARWERRFEGDEVSPPNTLWGWHLKNENHYIENAGWLIYDDDPQPTHWAEVP